MQIIAKEAGAAVGVITASLRAKHRRYVYYIVHE